VLAFLLIVVSVNVLVLTSLGRFAPKGAGLAPKGAGLAPKGAGLALKGAGPWPSRRQVLMVMGCICLALVEIAFMGWLRDVVLEQLLGVSSLAELLG
jgi:hypothetical protein